MDLPIELLNLILKQSIDDSYKTCIIVNKTFYGIIKKILDSIPDLITIQINHKGRLFDYDYNEYPERAVKENHNLLLTQHWKTVPNIKNPNYDHCGSVNPIFISKHQLLAKSNYHEYGIVKFHIPLSLNRALKHNTIHINLGFTSWNGVNCYIQYLDSQGINEKVGQIRKLDDNSNFR